MKVNTPGNGFCTAAVKRPSLQLVVTDGCPGLAAALQVVYPRVLHQRCWVHKMRNILEKVKKRDYEAVKVDAQAIYQSDSQARARCAFLRFCRRWRPDYPAAARQLERFARMAGILQPPQATLE